MNLQIKSGTNNLRGNVFEFLRNDAFDANNFFNNRAGRKKPDYKQNQPGGTLGGPIFKDLHRPSSPTTRASGSSRARRIDDRALDEDAQRRLLRDQPRHLRSADRAAAFAGNVILRNQWDPGVGQHPVAAGEPESNTAGTVGSTGQTITNQLINLSLNGMDNQFDVKVDHSLTSNNRF